MKKKITGFVAALAAMVAFMVMTPSPAMAFNSTWTEQHCQTFSITGLPGENMDICLTVGWRTQDDGTGIRVEDVRYSSNKCYRLENDGVDGFRDAYIKAAYPSDPSVGPSASWSYPNCGQWLDAEMKVDSSKAIIKSHVVARVDNSPDFTVYWDFAICKGNTC